MYVQQYMDNEYPLLCTIIVLEPCNIGYRVQVGHLLPWNGVITSRTVY